MSTLSVPLSPELEKIIQDLVNDGYGSNKADVVRKAIKKIAEEKVIADILEAEKEPTLNGDLCDLAKKF